MVHTCVCVCVKYVHESFRAKVENRVQRGSLEIMDD